MSELVAAISTKTIEELVKELCQSPDETQGKKYALVIDVSGSTGNTFTNQRTALDVTSINLYTSIGENRYAVPSTSNTSVTTNNILSKEIELATKFIVEHPDSEIMLYSFDSDFQNHGLISAMDDYVEFPEMRPGSSTYTHQPLQSILDNVRIFHPDEIIIYTDGQTNSSSSDILRIFTALHNLNIKINVIAVTNSNINLETISVREESTLAGMDLVNTAKNLIDKLVIYNRYHHTIPFQGTSNSNVDKNSLRFINVTLPKSADTPSLVIFIDFINNLIQKIDENKESLTWGNNNMSFKKMCTQIGLLLSVFYIYFPRDNSFVQEIAGRLSTVPQSSSISTPILTLEKIIDFFEYGYSSGRKKTPIIYTNLDEHVKESVVKQQEFKDAEQNLRTYGTTMNCNSFISLPMNGVCVIVEKE